MKFLRTQAHRCGLLAAKGVDFISTREFLSTYLTLVAVVMAWAMFNNTDALAEISIPNTLDVDALGGTILTKVATPLISVIGVSIVLLMILLGKRVIFRRSSQIASK